jgi:dihydrolipoamide dehydrogenase
MKHHDLCVIGAGPAGYAAAMHAAQLGCDVLLIERTELGGAGLRHGALSSKVMWEIAQEYYDAHDHARRFALPAGQIAFSDIQRQVEDAITTARQQWQTGLQYQNNPLKTPTQAHSQTHTPTQAHTHSPTHAPAYLQGEASFLDAHTLQVLLPDGSTTHIHADHIILATGSRPRTLPDIHIDEQVILSSDGIAGLTDFPESMVILGAGVIGCEFATIFALLGRTKVYLIDKAARILPFEDADLAAVVQRNLESQGAHIHKGANLVSMQAQDGRVHYRLKFADGHQEDFQAEKALVAVGRVPNVEDLGLAQIGVACTPRGHVQDLAGDTRTCLPHICAVGDLTSDIALVNIAELEGRHAVELLLGRTSAPLSYADISTIMFLHPEVAGVGLSEQDAQKLGIPYRAASIDYTVIPRAIAMRSNEGFIKLLADPITGKLLGMRAVGAHASSVLQAASLMIRNGIPVADLAALMHPHPSITEGVQECARALVGDPIRPGPWLRVWEWRP